jgi:hypothetical protein
VNETVSGALPLVGVAVKLAIGGKGMGGITVITWLAALAPIAFVANRVTVNVPGFKKTCDGFCCVLAGVPSPKFHDQLVTIPEEVSLN